MSQRNPEIDFLRGVAVLLVLFRHHWVGLDELQTLGWIGVDLFFVLSGFLVSGLLFAEYHRDGKIRPIRFLIRRGFKIYPLFYLSIAFTFLYLLFSPSELNWKGKLLSLLPELFFYQNYVPGFWGHHWSLAVEEHFYLLLTLTLFVLVHMRVLENARYLLIFVLAIFLLTFTFRVIANVYAPLAGNFGETHLRIDSLLAGVVIAYFFHFRFEELKKLYRKQRGWFLLMTMLPLSFAPWIESTTSVFVRTIGFSILYLSFSSLLIVFLFSKSIPKHVKHVTTGLLYKGVCRIGFYSYSIYLVHMYFPRFIVGEKYLFPGEYVFTSETVSSFAIYFFGSIIVGILVSRIIEIPMLRLRDRISPR